MEPKERLKEKCIRRSLLEVLRVEQFATGVIPYHEGIVRILTLATDIRFGVEVVHVPQPTTLGSSDAFGLASFNGCNANGISCYVPVQFA